MKKKPDLHIHIQLKGRYRLVLNEGTEREVDTGWFDNLVLDSGLNRLGQTTTPSTFVFSSIGTGTNLPAPSDTSLQAWVASATPAVFDSQSNLGPTNYPSTFQIHHVYAQGAVVGNMAEVGIGWASGGGSLFSRARILDGGGNPTTLTVIALDQLTVYYELMVTNPTADVTGSVTITGVGSVSYVGRMASAANFLASPFSTLSNNAGVEWGRLVGASGFPVKVYEASSVLGAITGEPSGTSSHVGTSTVASYTTGNFFRDSTVTLTPSQGNLSGGIGCIQLHYMNDAMNFQFSFSPVIAKDNTKTFTLTTRFSWGR